MDYDFTKFNSKDFEHLVQSLMQKTLGHSSLVFGEGPDGARELTFEGRASFPNNIDSWKGYWVVQAKFKSRDFTKRNDFEWLRKNFIKEMEKFQLGQLSIKIPNNYLIFSNVVLTPVNKTGGRDKIEALKKKYHTIIPNIFIAGYDEMCRLLDNNRDVRITYSHFLMSSDIVADTIEKLNASENRSKNQENLILSLKENIDKNDGDLDIEKIEKLRVLILENFAQVESRSFQLRSIADLTRKYDFSSKLINQVLWCLLVEEDANQAILLLDEDILKRQEQKLSLCRILKAKTLFMKLDFEGAERNFLQAKQINNSFQTAIQCAAFYSAMQLEHNAKVFYEEALILAETPIEQFQALNDLGNNCKRLKLYEEAQDYYLKQLVLLDENYNDLLKENNDYTIIIYAIINIGNFFSEVNDFEEAFKAYGLLLDVQDIWDELLTKQDQGALYGNIGICNLDFGNVDAACSYLEKSVDLLKESDENVDQLQILSNFLAGLGHTYVEQCRYQEALIVYQESLSILHLLYNIIPRFYVSNLVGMIRDICQLHFDFFPEKALEIIEEYYFFSKKIEDQSIGKARYNYLYIASIYFKTLKNNNLPNKHIYEEIEELLQSSDLLYLPAARIVHKEKTYKAGETY